MEDLGEHPLLAALRGFFGTRSQGIAGRGMNNEVGGSAIGSKAKLESTFSLSQSFTGNRRLGGEN